MLHRCEIALCLLLVGLIGVLIVSACGPAQSAQPIQAQVETGVAMTVDAQNSIERAVAMTVSALAPAATDTATATSQVPRTPTSTGTVTPLPSPFSGGGGGYTKPLWACDIKQRPFDETAYKPGDAFDIKWTITNTGSKTWAAGKDFKYSSGTQLTSATFVQMPEMKPYDTFSVSFDANAPLEKGRYVMTWIVEGGLCSTSVVIVSGRPGIDP